MLQLLPELAVLLVLQQQAVDGVAGGHHIRWLGGEQVEVLAEAQPCGSTVRRSSSGMRQGQGTGQQPNRRCMHAAGMGRRTDTGCPPKLLRCAVWAPAVPRRCHPSTPAGRRHQRTRQRVAKEGHTAVQGALRGIQPLHQLRGLQRHWPGGGGPGQSRSGDGRREAATARGSYPGGGRGAGPGGVQPIKTPCKPRWPHPCPVRAVQSRLHGDSCPVGRGMLKCPPDSYRRAVRDAPAAARLLGARQRARRSSTRVGYMRALKALKLHWEADRPLEWRPGPPVFKSGKPEVLRDPGTRTSRPQAAQRPPPRLAPPSASRLD